MKCLISGASGFIGSALCSSLVKRGMEVQPLVRGEGWDPSSRKLDPNLLVGADIVINLSGENIANHRWTEAIKRQIFESRIYATQTLVDAICSMESPPKILLNASAVGYYGDRGDEILNENSSPGSGFLSQVCKEWELATKPAEEKGVRTCNLRFGVVLAKEGGALKKMLTPFKLGLGGKIGSGQQYMSWISLPDLLQAVHFLIQRDDIQGPVNLVSPHPVTNLQFTEDLGKTLGRPTLFPMPAFAAKAAFGAELAEALLLSSARVVPKKLLDAHFEFQHPTLSEALRAIL